MKKYIISLCLLSSLTVYSSEHSGEEMHGYVATFETDSISETNAETRWSLMSVSYKEGGIEIPYNVTFSTPPIVLITPITTLSVLQQVTPVIVSNTDSELSVIVTLTTLLGLVREALDDEVVLNILAIEPNDHLTSIPYLPGLGSGA